MFEFYTSYFVRLNVYVQIDNLLLDGLDCEDKLSENRMIMVNLHELIYNIGHMQTRRISPSYRNKFEDRKDLLSLIFSVSNEFRVRVNALRIANGPDAIRAVSEDLGVGLSVCIASKLYNIDHTTVQKDITSGKGKRPDWSCQTQNQRVIVIESKGSISVAGSKAQLTRALQQKVGGRQGDIKIASASLINENEITSVKFVDPPIIQDNLDPQTRRAIWRAAHYTSVFSFLGHAELSRYFAQMKRRIERSITPIEQTIKDSNYRLILDEYNRVLFLGIYYHGTFLHLDNSRYIFTGVDPELISYMGFLTFQEYGEIIEDTILGNHYIRYTDGILVIEISDISLFNVDVAQIRNNQEYTVIKDIDVMEENSFLKWILYILERVGATRIDASSNSFSNRYDTNLIAVINEKRFIFELKLFKNPKAKKNAPLITEQIERLRNIFNDDYLATLVLVTNADIGSFRSIDNRIIVIGRHLLNTILEHPNSLITVLT